MRSEQRHEPHPPVPAGRQARRQPLPFEPGGAVDDHNELWPAFSANAAGAGNGTAVADRLAGDKAVSVVIHSSDGTPAPKVACADLG